jgi:hypothetical protein
MANTEELFKRLNVALERLAKVVPVGHENHVSLQNGRMWTAMNSRDYTAAVEIFEQLVIAAEAPGAPTWLINSLVQITRKLSQAIGDDEAPPAV